MTKEEVLQDLEFIDGGLFALKTSCNNDNLATILSCWQDIIQNLLDVISKGEIKNA